MAWSTACFLDYALDSQQHWITVGRSSKDNLDNTSDQLLEREDGQQKRSKRNYGCDSQACNVFQREWNNTHFAHNLIAISKIGKRLYVSGTE
jgi:hypothetical protein